MQQVPNVDLQILLNTQIQELSKICSTNRYFQSICSSFEFWTEYYRQHGLLLLSEKKNLTGYITDFQACSQILLSIDPYLSLLKRQWEQNGTLMQLKIIVDVFSLSVFSIPEVDFDKLERMSNQSRYEFIDFYLQNAQNFITDFDLTQSQSIGIGDGFIASLRYSFFRKTYTLLFSYQGSDQETQADIGYELDISEESARTLIYKYSYFRASILISPEPVSEYYVEEKFV